MDVKVRGSVGSDDIRMLWGNTPYTDSAVCYLLNSERQHLRHIGNAGGSTTFHHILGLDQGGLMCSDIIFDEPYACYLLDSVPQYNRNLRYYLSNRTPIKHIVSKTYIDDVNEKMIGRIYREAIKETSNAFDILQFTGDRSTKCNNRFKSSRQTRISTLGTLYGDSTRRHPFTYR